jgi:hypothetical protein
MNSVWEETCSQQQLSPKLAPWLDQPLARASAQPGRVYELVDEGADAAVVTSEV